MKKRLAGSPPIPSWAVRSIDWLLGERDLCLPSDLDVSEAIVETGESICCWNWLTIGNVLAATSAAVLGLIKVALAKSFCPFWVSLDCSESGWIGECTPIGDVIMELQEKRFKKTFPANFY